MDPVAWADLAGVVAGASFRVDRNATAVHALSQALPPDAFRRAVVVGRHADVGHPFAEAAIATGRVIRS